MERVFGPVHCFLNLPQASPLLGMTILFRCQPSGGTCCSLSLTGSHTHSKPRIHQTDKGRRGILDLVISPLVSPSKRVLLLKPRGFCAGVVRAIDVVNIALDTFGAPIYVRKEIVHNRFVVNEL